jgi:putative endonuclease
MNYVYMVKCSDESLYTGWTTDIESRILMHNSGKGAKYTRSKLPVELVYMEAYETKSEALKREHAIKRLSHDEKAELIKYGGHDEKRLHQEAL